jgi:tetratricopeptide (TPR) repeat protein
MPKSWGAVARRGARQLSAPSNVGAYEDHRSVAAPSQPAIWVRDERPTALEPGTTGPSPRPRAELPGDVVAAVRTAGASLTNRGREHLVTITAEAVEAYNRGRYQDAARWIRPVAEVAPSVPAIREIAGLANYRAGKWRAALVHLRAHADLTADVTHLPAVMDCERALGHPRKVGWIFEEVRAASPTTEVLSEARIVLAATLSDRGKLAEAIALLVDAGADRRVRNPADRHVRQWYVLADLYERSGDVPKARELFTRVALADPGAYDVDDRIEELGGRVGTARRRPR